MILLIRGRNVRNVSIKSRVSARCYASVFARSRQKRLSGMKENRGERNGGTSPVWPRCGGPEATGRTDGRTRLWPNERKTRNEKGNERAQKGKTGV